MARVFNGSSDAASSAVDLSGYSAVHMTFWAWIDSYDNAGNRVLLEYGSPNYDSAGASGFILVPNWTDGNFLVGFAKTGGSWLDSFARPSAAGWHNYSIGMNRAGPTNLVWVDGVAQTLNTVGHSAGAFGNFGNGTQYFGSRAGSSLFTGCRIAGFMLWGGVTTDTLRAEAFAAGASPYEVLTTGTVALAIPMFGDSPEPDYSGFGRNATLTGTTIEIHPGVQPIMVPRVNR